MHDRASALAAIMPSCLAGPAVADVDLFTIPRREGTQLTIYNGEDITMVRELRLLTVKPGVNRIQFSSANTLIDPTSIDFRILDHQDQVDLTGISSILLSCQKTNRAGSNAESPRRQESNKACRWTWRSDSAADRQNLTRERKHSMRSYAMRFWS
jgi:hypothetical protein